MTMLTDLPIELFLDHLFPLLPVSDLLNLSCTNRYFQELASDEAFWHRKIQEDFNFSGSETARNTGWKFLYRRLTHPKVFVWGERRDGRLGLPEEAMPDIGMREGAPFPVQLRIPGVRIVTIAAGGMSFHALDARGDVHVWGALDGSGGPLNSDGFSIPYKRAAWPMKLRLPVKFRSISCGRLHCTALDASFGVWTFTSWGRPFRLLTPLFDKSTPESTPIQVESGWAFSSVLTEAGDVLVYWPFGGRVGSAVTENNAVLDEQSVIEPTKATPTSQEPNVIPCYHWDLQNADPVRLPPIPVARLPQLSGTGLSDKLLDAETKLVKIAGLDNIIVGLTNKGHVLMYDSLGGEDSYRQGHWEYLPAFSEVEEVRAHTTFSEQTASETDEKPLSPPTTMQITHISAQFETFVAYSTGASSVVLIGKPLDRAQHDVEPLRPTILPALQNRGVISVVLGDYHYGALTAGGTLLTWGAFSKGALGLGNPLQVPVGQPGGFTSETDRQTARTRWGVLRVHPPAVGVPTEVRFDHGEPGGRRRARYCFAVAAGGWHMGALAIDLEPDEEGGNDDDDDSAVDIPGAFPSNERGSRGDVHILPHGPLEVPMLPFGRGRLPFRLGFAARGRNLGGRGRGRG